VLSGISSEVVLSFPLWKLKESLNFPDLETAPFRKADDNV